jgi:intracellular multiplication protein IcmE
MVMTIIYPNDENEDMDDFNSVLDEDSFDEQKSKAASLSNLLQGSAGVKIAVVAGVFFLVIGGIVLFGGNDKTAPTSSVGTSQTDLSEVPGVNQLTPAYEQAVRDENEQALEEAIKNGQSSMPIAIAPPEEVVAPEGTIAEDDNPLKKWQRLQEETPPTQQNFNAAAPQVVDPQVEAAAAARQQALADMKTAMSDQISSLLDSQKINGAKTTEITEQPSAYQKYIEEKTGSSSSFGQSSGQGQFGFASNNGQNNITNGNGFGGFNNFTNNNQNQNIPQEPVKPAEVIVPAGKIEYAQLLIDADSDVGGTIIAELASGNLAGHRILGSFQTRNNKLILNFNSIVVDGVTQPIEAFAIDPNKQLGALVTSVNYRLISRVILPAAASFVEGLASARAQRETNVVLNNNGNAVQGQPAPTNRQEVAKGVERAAERLTQVVDNQANNTQPQVVVDAGTPMGIVFVQAVVEDTDQNNGQNPVQNQGFGQNFGQGFGQNPYISNFGQNNTQQYPQNTPFFGGFNNQNNLNNQNSGQQNNTQQQPFSPF